MFVKLTKLCHGNEYRTQFKIFTRASASLFFDVLMKCHPKYPCKKSLKYKNNLDIKSIQLYVINPVYFSECISYIKYL